VALQGMSSTAGSPEITSGFSRREAACIQGHDLKPGRVSWLPGSRHVGSGYSQLEFDSRCPFCREALEDFIVRRRAPSELVLRYLRMVSQET
jgi:hypothetical protein